MSYYDPSPIIHGTDTLIISCETRVKTRKRGELQSSYFGKAFLPPSLQLEWLVIIGETGEILTLKQWVNKVGKIEINLIDSNMYWLRKGHYNNTPHRNPDDSITKGPHHIHFPTTKYPTLDVQRQKWAYSVDVNGNYLEALIQFNRHTNIRLRGSIPLWSH